MAAILVAIRRDFQWAIKSANPREEEAERVRDRDERWESVARNDREICTGDVYTSADPSDKSRAGKFCRERIIRQPAADTNHAAATISSAIREMRRRRNYCTLLCERGSLWEWRHSTFRSIALTRESGRSRQSFADTMIMPRKYTICNRRP